MNKYDRELVINNSKYNNSNICKNINNSNNNKKEDSIQIDNMILNIDTYHHLKVEAEKHIRQYSPGPVRRAEV